MILEIPTPDLHALAAGEIIVAFVPRGICTEGEELELGVGPPRIPQSVKSAYRRWLDADPPEGVTAVVVMVGPAALLDPAAGSARHVLAATPHDGDLAILRVFGPAGPVLSDEAFTARRASVEGALQ